MQGNKSDVYKGEVAQVDMVPELVGRFDGIIDGLRSLVEVARDGVGGVGGDVFDEVDPVPYERGPTSVSAPTGQWSL